jgi:hypothetical protein
MKKITTMLVALLLCAIPPQVRADGQNHAETRCSNADLRGAYSFVASGTFVVSREAMSMIASG